MRYKERATYQELRTPGGSKGEREWEGCLAHCSARCTPKGKREKGDREIGGRRPCNQGRGAGQGERGRADRGQDKATGPGHRGGREGALPRELLRTVLALAGGQRVRDGRAEKGVTWCPTTERAARSVRGHWARRGAAACCHKAARPQRCTVLCACVVSCIEGRQGRGKRARAGRKR